MPSGNSPGRNDRFACGSSPHASSRSVRLRISFRGAWLPLALCALLSACGGSDATKSASAAAAAQATPSDAALARARRLALSPVKTGVAATAVSNFEAPHVHPIDITPDGTGLLAVNTANGTLEIFDATLATPALRKVVKVGVDPVTVRAASNDEAWVVNRTSRSVDIVDLRTGEVADVLQTDDEPADVVFAGTPRRAFVSCSMARTLLVFDPADRTRAPLRRTILGEQARALAASPDGSKVYLAIFESGNGTTALTGGKDDGFEVDITRDPRGPYGGVSPPPNSANATRFNPPLNPANPAPPPVSMIVRKDGRGGWLDDNGRDWRRFVSGDLAGIGGAGGRAPGWDLVDRDVAVIDTQTLAIEYRGGMANIVMSLAVNPATGAVTTVGTDALNQIRYEPVLRGTFLRVQSASFDPRAGAPAVVNDLNPHLDYSVASIPPLQRTLSIGDPRGIAWNAAGTRAYVTGMGSNNVVVLEADGSRTGDGIPIAVDEGPTGIVLQEDRHRAFVMNKFAATISVVDLASRSETARVPLSFDPTPAAVRAGRPLLYNTQLFSGLGHIACASCHVDARTDRLAWDLGDPSSPMLSSGGFAHHPMKGPMLTQTLIDAVQAPFLHWRGDRSSLDAFANAFQTLQAADRPATSAEVQQLKDFLATTRTPPNPFRNLDNSFPSAVKVPGPNGTIARVGNAELGRQEFESNCRSCHPGHTGRGANFVRNEFGIGQRRNPPRWQNFYRRIGLWFKDPKASTAGFGFQQDGTFDSTHNGSRTDDMMAFMMAFNGSFPYSPPGLNATNTAVDAHAAVGRQVVLTPADDGGATLTTLIAEADRGAIGLVVSACDRNERRGFAYRGRGLLQTDRSGETISMDALREQAAAGTPVVVTAVRNGTQDRIGIDENLDGVLDGDGVDPRSRACVSAPIPVNLLVNGSFETNSLKPPSWALTAGLAGWSNTAGQIEIWRGLNGWSAAHGESWIELDALPRSHDVVSQRVSTIAGQRYRLTYSFSARPGVSAASNAFAVQWNGAAVDQQAPSGATLSAPDWHKRTLEIVGTGSDLLSFVETGTDDGFGGLIDAVSLVAIDGSTPPPPPPPPPPTGGNLLVNGSFETNAVEWHSTSWLTTLPGWSNAAGAIEVWREYNAWPAADGASWIELDVRGSSHDLVCQQATGTVAGQRYSLGYAFSARPGVPAASNAFQLLWNGAVVDAQAPSGSGLSAPQWQRVTLAVVALGNDRLCFSESGTDDGVGALIDDVSLQANP